MNILAIDASTKASGYAIFVDDNLASYGCITENDSNVLNRIDFMSYKLDKLLENDKIEKVFIEDVMPEEVQHNQGVYKALMYLQGAIAMKFNKSGYKLNFFVASEWRKKCGIRTGRGIKRKDLKDAAILFVKNNYGIDVEEDVAEAICIGHAALNKKEPTQINESAF